MKKLGKIIGFGFGLWVLLILASLVFIPKDTMVKDGMPAKEAFGFLAERKNSIDVVFLGDSLPAAGIVPPVIWNDQGIPTYVCASPTNMDDEKEFFADFLARQSPKAVVVEVDGLYGILDRNVWIRNKMFRCIPLLAFHDNWKKVPLGDLLRPFDYRTQSIGKGSYVKTKICGWEGANYVIPTDREEAISGINLFELKAIKRMCDRRGIQLILCYTPSPGYWNYARYNALSRLAQEMGVTYLDLNLSMDGQMDWETDTCDGGYHLSAWGAFKVSHFLGEYLAQTGLFTDKRNDPAYQSWNENYDAYMAYIRGLATEKETDYEPPL